MMGAALLLLATIASIELIRALGLMAAFGRTARIARRALRIVPRTGVSEWAKERALRCASARLLGASLRSGLLLMSAGIYSNVIRVLVPLTIADGELDEALDVWERALEHVLSA